MNTRKRIRRIAWRVYLVTYIVGELAFILWFFEMMRIGTSLSNPSLWSSIPALLSALLMVPSLLGASIQAFRNRQWEVFGAAVSLALALGASLAFFIPFHFITHPSDFAVIVAALAFIGPAMKVALFGGGGAFASGMLNRAGQRTWDRLFPKKKPDKGK